MRRMYHKQAGFTLIEILVVVVILGIAGAIVIPQITSRDDLKTSAAARSLMADLIYAQNLSITRQKNYCVIFDTANGSYSIVEASGMTPITNPVSLNPYVVKFGPNGSAGLESTSLESAIFTGQSGTTQAIIGFDELGTPLAYPTAGAPETMTQGAIILRTGSQRLQVDIEAFTGMISIRKP